MSLDGEEKKNRVRGGETKEQKEKSRGSVRRGGMKDQKRKRKT